MMRKVSVVIEQDNMVAMPRARNSGDVNPKARQSRRLVNIREAIELFLEALTEGNAKQVAGAIKEAVR